MYGEGELHAHVKLDSSDWVELQALNPDSLTCYTHSIALNTPISPVITAQQPHFLIF